MKINLRSFRFRIIMTLIIAIALFSSVAVYTYNQLIFNKFYANSDRNIENILYSLRSEIIHIHDGRLIKPILKNVESEEKTIRLFLMDADGNITFPPADSIDRDDTINFSKIITSDKEVQVMTSRSNRRPSSLAVLQIRNLPECYECHPAEEKNLGYVALNISLSDTESTLAFARTFSILFTTFTIIIIMVFVMIMHLRFIKTSLSSFQHTIKSINDGNLDERVKIRKTRELEQLGYYFNHMVDNFQKTQQELSRYHNKELESAEKLAKNVLKVA